MALSTAEQEVIAARAAKLREDLVERFFVAFGNAGVKFGAEGIQRQIINELTKERRSLALKMIGFDDRFGKLELDRSNDRKTIAGTFIEQNAGPAVEARGRDKLNSATVMNAVIRDFDNQFMYAAQAGK